MGIIDDYGQYVIRPIEKAYQALLCNSNMVDSLLAAKYEDLLFQKYLKLEELVEREK